MTTKGNRELKIETHELTVVRVNRSQVRTIFCSVCRENTQHFSVSRAASAMALSESAVFRLAESGEIHSTEETVGPLWICANSFSVLNDERQDQSRKALATSVENLTNEEK